MLILDKRKAIERVVALTVEGAAVEPEARPRRAERRDVKRARRAAATGARRVAAVEASEEDEETAAPA